jgi:serine/threonine protein phosphatase PrpC
MWQKISASVQGTSHLRLNLPCQDAHECVLDEHHAIIAVADGLGSAVKAEEGAKLASVSAVEAIRHMLSIAPPLDTVERQQLLYSGFAAARQALEALACETETPLRDYGTTLIVVVLSNDWFAVGQLGDGAVVALFSYEDAQEGNTQAPQLSKEKLRTVSKPQRGEYANETLPITLPNALELVHLLALPIAPQAIAILTDGLQSLAINTQTGIPYEPFFSPFFEAILQPLASGLNIKNSSQLLADFLRSERVCARTDDDKTLVIVGKTEG